MSGELKERITLLVVGISNIEEAENNKSVPQGSRRRLYYIPLMDLPDRMRMAFSVYH